MSALDACQTLVLNADYRPLSYYPLSLWSWRDAVHAVFSDRVNLVATYDHVARSPSTVLKVPSVVALRAYVPLKRRPAFSRVNLFLRDGFRCQYCGRRFPSEELTFDHLLPRSRGGRASWTNIVTACMDCNSRKGSNSPADCGLRPIRPPAVPTARQLHDISRSVSGRPIHASWRDYLYWNVELDPA